MHRITRNFLFIFIISGLFVLGISCKDKAEKGEEHAYTNALVNESSPYLLQHAHNPVNWVPWSEEALEQAREEGKLIIVSIGYSSCHWCHVMEEETFEDEEVAELMNEHFISIKVDREERPDVDEVYMTAVQLMTGNGGWPLNVILLPNGKPLYGGTYHTKKQWMEVLNNVNTKYNEDKAGAENYADRVAKGVAEVNFIPRVTSETPLPEGYFDTALAPWKAQWDMQKGGDMGQQKFIVPIKLDFLLDYFRLEDDLEADVFVKNTLDKIIQGGIYDHVGGGFFRYSTDADWKVPHFEKMLYDNAQLLSIYSKAYAIYNEPAYKEVVEQTAAFLEREMKRKEGGYFAAIDADSEGVEGAFYTWKMQELKALLGSEFELFADYFSVSPAFAWEKDRYVLYKRKSDPDFAGEHNLSLSQLSTKTNKWEELLLQARGEREAPRKDDKIITSWNALLISGYLDAYKAFGAPSYLDRAKGIFETLRSDAYINGRLLHSFKTGSTREEGFLEDYAFLARASFGLFEVTLDTVYLDFTTGLMETIMSDFYDEASGMYEYNDSSALISKIIKVDDGVIPSANSVVAETLVKLGHLKYDKTYLERADEMIKTLSPRVSEAIVNYALWANLLLSQTRGFYEVVSVGNQAEALTTELHGQFIPNALVVGSSVASDLALFKDRFFENETLIYVCTNNTCKRPVKTTMEALQQLQDFRKN
ncbi:thioredoxin domain-containing protein [Muriicola marianensis]|uniref:Thioredoxin n=1 Tax=Muriicola marianensis TaxID=1324801 RepID=A0ABQ1QTI9_9FLAO|nr:thioredoxin domain-containing protein [Muriicola marianensis]GGD41464.1 thioredoxin [Muriicola marianensis]